MPVNNSSEKKSLSKNENKKSGPDFNSIDLLLKNLRGLGPQYKEVSNLFSVKPANEWLEEAKRKPVQKKLFGSLFFEIELYILFADKNHGKSVLAIQIGESVSSGSRVPPFELEASPQKVLYVDFELNDIQFLNRYSEDDQHYKFHSNFYRAELFPETEEAPSGYESFEDNLIKSLESQILSTGSNVVIVDNITYLRSNNETAKDA